MKATTSSSPSKLRRPAQIALGILLVVLLAVAALAIYLAVGFRAVSKTEGEIQVAGLQAPVQIIRDDRDIPHIRAKNEHDLFFAQGFAEGSDRLFQIDLTRHFVYGRLSEWFGNLALATDERSRTIDVRGIVAAQWNGSTPAHRDQLQAFSDGVNAAMRLQPRPFEYRLLFATPHAWTPQDSLAVGFATVLDLADPYQDVLQRDAVYRRGGNGRYNEANPLSDPKYDVPLVGTVRARGSDLHPSSGIFAEPKTQNSNEWAAGAARTATGRALLANDPHLDLGIPGIWYLADLQAPGYHAAGASLAGTPGIILGHNDRIAWGATNGTVAALSVFHMRAPEQRFAVPESFAVRLSGTRTKTYYREPRGFYVQRGGAWYLVEWFAYSKPRSPLDAFDGLDRARSVDDGISALALYPGPTQNFVLAGTDGRAGYALAGWIPNDPVWAMHAHDSAVRAYPAIPFAELPHVTPSRDAVVFTANNRMYGDGYRYRLSPTFAPPYRAFRIWQLLQARKKYDAAYFTQMQNDVASPAEREFAALILSAAQRRPQQIADRERPLLDALRAWDGRMTPDSAGATLVHALRVSVVRRWPGNLAATLQLQRTNTKPAQDDAFLDATLHAALKTAGDPQALLRPWKDAGAVPILNPLHAFGITWLDGTTLPGDGDSYTVHAQNTNFNQSFRAVWDVGNWDAGGIVIPAGESGQPASPHYQDLTATYVQPVLVALPFSDAALSKHAAGRLTLQPAQPSAP